MYEIVIAEFILYTLFREKLLRFHEICREETLHLQNLTMMVLKTQPTPEKLTDVH